MRAWTLLTLTALVTACGNGTIEVEDRDEDGFDASEDCNDLNAAVYPGADELCDGIDNDCNGTADDGEPADADTWFADEDGDGFGDPETVVIACDLPAGYVAQGGDCDDTDTRFNPAAAETDCTDPTDYNCDGSVGFADEDGDGFPACEDCNDADGAVNDDAIEVCNGIDDNCNRVVDLDAADPPVWHLDQDGDGFGNAKVLARQCDPPSESWIEDATDCDDSDPITYPGAEESCDGLDNDCDGDLLGEEADLDGDEVLACAGDCDDRNEDSYPGADEICDEEDNDCDGSEDEDPADGTAFYRDADGDGFGDVRVAVLECEAPGGYVADNTDCDDARDETYPGADETCNKRDDDCDGVTDEDDAVDARTWYADSDGDGFGLGSSSRDACTAPFGYVGNDRDCDDTDIKVSPAATEICNGKDDDCDGTSDVGAVDEVTFYRDVDGDRYGDDDVTTDACTAPTGYVSADGDCDDADKDINPGEDEVCDGDDNDCDGTVDNDEDVLGDAEACAAVSCVDIDSERSSPADGDYWIDADGDGDGIELYCDFTTTGGPFTWVERTGLQAYWSFDGTSPSTADFGGFTSTWRGSTRTSTTRVASDFGRSVYFDNSDSTRADMTGTRLRLGSNHTVMMWGYLRSCSNNQVPLIFSGGTAWYGDMLYLSRAYSRSFGDIGSNFTSACTSSLNLTNWVHYAWVDNGSSLVTYRNGVVVPATSGSYRSVAGSTFDNLGSYAGFGTNGFAGEIDDVAFFTRALTAAEIKKIHDAGRDEGLPLRSK